MISCSFIRTPFVDNLVSRIHFLFFAGELASFRFSSFFVTKRAARFRRVALKKLLSVFAEQPRAFLGTFISCHILSPKSTQLCPNSSIFVQVCPTCARKPEKIKKFSRLVQFRFCRAVLGVKGGLIIHAPFAKAAYAAKC